MHGRLKVRTTEEQAAAKRFEQEKKLKIFIAVTKQIFEKREKQELDDEALALCREILSHNPDITTLWNFRREILLFMKNSLSEEDIENHSTDELGLTEVCLKKNPKSYNTWHHRFWVMEYMPHPDWKLELKLCKAFLQTDERNFHCWDYRRRITKKCYINNKDELDFTTELIATNFSNYSAWHYRSTLLPLVHPGIITNSVDEETKLKEYDIVQNAAFTDPNDQSVWFYHRWLLGRDNEELKLLSMSVLSEESTVMTLFSQPVTLSSENAKVYMNKEVTKTDWKPVGEKVTASQVWYTKLPYVNLSPGEGSEVCLSVTIADVEHTLICHIKGKFSIYSVPVDKSKMFCAEMNAATKDVLQKELESCEQLYQLEPQNKWVLFTCVLLMRALDHQKYDLTIFKYLEQLMVIDDLRINYYKDLKSKFVIENFMEDAAEGLTNLSLSKMNILSLHHLDHFYSVRFADFSGNMLTDIYPVRYLISTEVLILDDNKISDCKDIKYLLCLKEVSIKNNQIRYLHNLQSLKTCKALHTVRIGGNSIIENSAFEVEIENGFPQLTFDVGL